MVPQLGRMVGGFSVISQAGTVKMGITTDKSMIENPHEIMDLLDEQLDKIMPHGWKNYNSEDFTGYTKEEVLKRASEEKCKQLGLFNNQAFDFHIKKITMDK